MDRTKRKTASWRFLQNQISFLIRRRLRVGASILLMGPHSKVITPSIVESWFGTASELTATLALIQTLVVAAAVAVLVVVTRRINAHSVN